jgi:hypothetical protein
MLQCEECERTAATASDARRWRAYFAGDPEIDDPREELVVVYCPECARREFGQRHDSCE